MLAAISCGVPGGSVKAADSLFGGPTKPEPTLDDLMNQVGADFTLGCMRQGAIRDQIRAVQALPGNSVATPVYGAAGGGAYGLRGAIGAGLRAIADRYFTPKPLSADNIPGYRRIGQ